MLLCLNRVTTTLRQIRRASRQVISVQARVARRAKMASRIAQPQPDNKR